jgi:glycosyltransferase involved in cell wall biosynthesis
MPRVSVLIPTYNCARFLGRAIDSALAQTYKDYEIIVVDDGSTDDTRDVVAQYGSKVLYFFQHNQGLSPARNLTLSKASGEFIAYLDADDMWYPQKLERQVAFLDTHPECGLVHSEVSVIDEADKVIHCRFNHETQRPVPQAYCIMDLLRRCHIQILTVVERRDCLDRVGNFDGRLFVAQDYLHWITVAMHGMAIGYLDEPLGMYRWRNDSLLSNQSRFFEDLVSIYDILLHEQSLEQRCGQEAAAIVSDQLYTVQRKLAYLERVQGRHTIARRHILRLIRQWPLRAELYLDFLKACVASAQGSRLELGKTQ